MNTADLYGFILPFYMLLSKLLNKNPQAFQRKYIKANNRKVMKTFSGCMNPEKILVLLPHCLQHSECNIRIIFNPENCIKCGKCDFSGILELSEKLKFRLAIATGGTLARKIVREVSPDFIIAVACEQDLALGIYDVEKIPVYGILNDRPEGPCINTKIQVSRMQQVLDHFMKKEEI